MDHTVDDEAFVSSIITGAMNTERAQIDYHLLSLLKCLHHLYYKDMVTSSNLENLVKMLSSDDSENWIVAQEIITQKWEELYGSDNEP